jgi:hypothetical protein
MPSFVPQAWFAPGVSGEWSSSCHAPVGSCHYRYVVGNGVRVCRCL